MMYHASSVMHDEYNITHCDSLKVVALRILTPVRDFPHVGEARFNCSLNPNTIQIPLLLPNVSLTPPFLPRKTTCHDTLDARGMMHQTSGT